MVTRNVALNELNFRGISVNAEADNVTAITLVASDSGLVLINKETSGTVTYTLPAVALGKGKMFWFYSAAAQPIAITSPTATTLNTAGSLTTTLTSASSIGECAMVIGDGSFYYLFEIYGTWS